MIFEPQIKNFETTYHKNDLLNHLNPSKKLFCVCIGIHDYTGIEPVTEKFNISLGEICNND